MKITEEKAAEAWLTEDRPITVRELAHLIGGTTSQATTLIQTMMDSDRYQIEKTTDTRRRALYRLVSADGIKRRVKSDINQLLTRAWT
ncbi:hypothetical protein [Ferrimonas marina]|uniref:Uncharacterized protein n=1 Tax=Ferrimonas marina TaxID=299255 RepID=A0A1M5UCX6_9GAMM|nr:hypothetical protein [Ferrimonas marina]SHH60513.1 hypothetical protein SAMN02745129_2495 [Ferrimonas marina]